MRNKITQPNPDNYDEVVIYENGTARTIRVPKKRNGPCKTCGKPTKSHKGENNKFQCHDCWMKEHPIVPLLDKLIEEKKSEGENEQQ